MDYSVMLRAERTLEQLMAFNLQKLKLLGTPARNISPYMQRCLDRNL